MSTNYEMMTPIELSMRYGLITRELTLRVQGKVPGENEVSTEALQQAHDDIIAETVRRTGLAVALVEEATS